MSSNNKIKVAIKSRPLLKREIDLKLQPSWKIKDNTIREAGDNNVILDFDHIFDEDVSTQEVFDVVGKPIVDQAIKGFNGTIFAYGQTASGKTHTMMGDASNPGVMVLAAQEIFKKIAQSMERLFLLRVGYIELYNEKIYDLLGPTDKDNKQNELKIHESINGEVNVNCVEHIIKTEEEIVGYLYSGNQKRKIGETKMNERSSRSHSIFRIIIESRDAAKHEEAIQISVLNLVDLAGSEKASQTGATGLRLKEGSNINKSLLFLGQVINQLAEPASADKFISYRDSKLTRILQASLGGNALTAIICTINPTALDETQSTLNFALRAKCIDNKPKKNEVVSDSAMINRLEKEVKKLKTELEMEKSRNGKIKIAQLESRINEENLKMLNASTITVNKDKFKSGRRRTWCPSSYGENIENIDDILPPLGLSSNLPAPVFKPQKSQISRFKNFLTPQVFNRDFPPQKNFTPSCESLPSLDDEFPPDQNMTLTSPRTPSKPPTCTECGSRKSIGAQFPLRVSLTPVGTRERFRLAEEELEELKEFSNFSNLEKEAEIGRLCSKVNELEETIESINKERVELEQAANRFAQVEQQNQELNESNEKLKKQNAELEQQNREAVALEFEFQRLQGKSKLRENELLELLEERDKHIQQLETEIANTLKNPLKSQKSTECLIEKLEREKCQIVDLELKLSDKQREIQELNKKIEEYSDFEKEKMEISMKYEMEHSRLEKENEDLKLDVDKFLSEINSMKQMASLFETELNSANNLLKESQEKSESLQKELDALKAQQETLQKEKELLQAEYDEASDQMMTYVDENEKLITEIEELKKNDETLLEIQTKYKKVVDEMEQIKENNIFEYEKVFSDREKLSNDLKEITSKYEALLESDDDNNFKEKYENERMEKEKLLNDIEDLKSHVTTKEKELATLLNEKDETEKMNEILILDKDTIQEEKELIEQELEKLKETLQTEQTNLVNLKTSYEEITAKYQEISAQHEATVNEKANLVKSLDSLKTEYSELSESAHSSQCSTGEIIDGFFDKLKYLKEIEIVSNDDSRRVYKTSDVSSKESSQLRLLIQDFVNVRQSSCTLTGEGYVISGKIQELPFSLMENQHLNMEDSLQADYNELKEKYEKIIIEFSNYQDNSNNERAARRKMEARIESLEQIERDLEANLVKSTNSYEERNQRCDVLEKECDELKMNCELNAKELEDAKSKIQILEEKEISSQQVLDELKEKYEQSLSDIEEARSKVDLCQQDLEAKESSLNEIIKNLEEKDISSQEMIEDFKSKYEQSSRDLEEAQSKLDQCQKDLEDKANSYKNIIKNLEERLTTLEEDDCKKLEPEVVPEELEEKIKDLNEENQSLVLEIEKLQKELQTATELFNLKTSELEQIISQNSQDLQQKHVELEELKLSIETTKEELQSLKLTLDEKTEELRLSTEKLEEKQQKIVELEESKLIIETTKEELESLKLTLDDKTEELRLSTEKLEERQQELVSLEEANQESSELLQQKCLEIKSITEVLEQTKSELKSSSDLLTKANQRESELKDDLKSLEQQFESFKSSIQNENSETLQQQNLQISQQNKQISELQASIKEYCMKEELHQQELAQSIQTIEDLKNQINDCKIEITRLEAEGARTTEELRRNLESLAVIEHESKSKDSQFENLYKEASECHQSLKRSELESEELRKSLESLKSSNILLDRALNEKQKEFDEIFERLEGLRKLEPECKELTNQMESLRATNIKLDQALNEKQREFDAIAKKLESFEEIEKEMSVLKTEKEKSQKLQLDLEVLEMSCKELESSQLTLRQELAEKDEKVKCLQKSIDELQTTRKVIESKMRTSEHSLRQQINALQAEKDTLTRVTNSSLSNGVKSSPTKQKLLDENDILKKKNYNLSLELDRERNDREKKLTLSSRKTRRQSTHDESRSFSKCFGQSKEVEIQTDPANESCSCVAMNTKIKDLERKLLFSTKAVECMKMEMKINPFKEENAKLRKTIEEMETKQTMLRHEIKKHRKAPPPRCQVCLESSNRITKDSFTDTELSIVDLDRQEAEIQHMTKKIDDLKYVCRERKRRNDEYRQELDSISREKAKLELKYTQAKLICEKRLNEIQQLKGSGVVATEN